MEMSLSKTLLSNAVLKNNELFVVGVSERLVHIFPFVHVLTVTACANPITAKNANIAMTVFCIISNILLAASPAQLSQYTILK